MRNSVLKKTPAKKAPVKAPARKTAKKKPTKKQIEETPPEISEPEELNLPVEEEPPTPLNTVEEKEAPKRVALATRLKALLAREIADIEAQSLGELAEADREKIARRLSSLVRTFDKLNEIERLKKAGRKKKSAYGEKEHDAMRDEIRRRLARIADAGGAGNVSRNASGPGNGIPAA